MNSVAERCMQDISARSRSLLNRSGLHLSQWEITTRHAVYLKNKSPTKALPFGEARSLSQAITPFEAYYNRQPDSSKLRCSDAGPLPGTLNSQVNLRKISNLIY